MNIKKKEMKNNNMEDLTSLKNLATEKYYLRYPRMDVAVTPPSRETYNGIVVFITFLPFDDKLVFIEDKYSYSAIEDIVKVLPKLQKRFKDRCELTLEKYILEKGNYINEPYSE